MMGYFKHLAVTVFLVLSFKAWLVRAEQDQQNEHFRHGLACIEVDLARLRTELRITQQVLNAKDARLVYDSTEWCEDAWAEKTSRTSFDRIVNRITEDIGRKIKLIREANEESATGPRMIEIEDLLEERYDIDLEYYDFEEWTQEKLRTAIREWLQALTAERRIYDGMSRHADSYRVASREGIPS